MEAFFGIAKELGAWAVCAFAAAGLAWFLLKAYMKSRDDAAEILMNSRDDAAATLAAAMEKRISALEKALTSATTQLHETMRYQRDEAALLAREAHGRERALIELLKAEYRPSAQHQTPLPEDQTTIILNNIHKR